jgi:hypothetical protein
MADIQDILTEWGTFYRDGGQDQSRILTKPYRPVQTEALFQLIPTDDTSYQMGTAELDRVLQPFQPGWTPLGKLKVSPIVLMQTPFKVDLEENPDTIENSWLGFLADKNLDRAQWPLIRYIIEVHLYARMDEDYELNEIYFGKYAAPTAGTPGAAGTGMDGIRTLINRAVQQSKITPIALGALPTDPLAFCEYIEAFVDKFTQRYRGRAMQVCMNLQLARRYAKGWNQKYKLDLKDAVGRPILDGNGEVLLQIPIEFSKHTVVGLESMGTSEKIWATHPENRKRLTKKAVNTKSVRVESAKRQVSVYTDFYKGLGFPVLEAVFTNELDLTL